MVEATICPIPTAATRPESSRLSRNATSSSPLSPCPPPTGTTTRAILIFGGSLLDQSSLPDDRSIFSIIGSHLLDISGRMVDADGEGGTGTPEFLRLRDAADSIGVVAGTGANPIYDENGNEVFATVATSPPSSCGATSVGLCG